MAQTIFTVSDLLYLLVTGTIVPGRHNLYCLAELQGSEIEELQTFWLLIPDRRRHRIAHCCLDIAQTSPTLQFNAFFLHLLTDPDPSVRQMALEGLAIDVDRKAAPAILALLDAETRLPVRMAAVRTVGQFLLDSELHSWNPQLRRELLTVLLPLWETPRTPQELQCCALESMGYSSDVDAQHALEDALVSDLTAVRVSALRGIGRSADRSWDSYILEAFDDTAPEVRQAAVQAAGKLQLRSFLDICLTIIEYETDPDLRLATIQTLGQLGGAVAHRALLSIAAADDPEEAAAVSSALDTFADADDYEFLQTGTAWE